MRALTIQGLWAHLIIHGPKRIENRPVAATFRGELAIHVGKNRRWDQSAYNLAEQLGNVRPLENPVPCRGFQSFWQVPEHIEREIRRLTLPAVASPTI